MADQDLRYLKRKVRALYTWAKRLEKWLQRWGPPGTNNPPPPPPKWP